MKQSTKRTLLVAALVGGIALLELGSLVLQNWLADLEIDRFWVLAVFVLNSHSSLPPTLLAVWAALGRGNVPLRIVSACFVLMLFELARSEVFFLVHGRVLDPRYLVFQYFAILLLSLGELLTLRWTRGWRLAVLETDGNPVVLPHKRLSIRSILFLTALAASTFGLMRTSHLYAIRVLDAARWLFATPHVPLQLVGHTIHALLVPILVWAILAPQARRGWLLAIGGWLAIFAVQLSILMALDLAIWPYYMTGPTHTAGGLAWVCGALGILRLAGYRLVRLTSPPSRYTSDSAASSQDPASPLVPAQ